MAAAEPDGVAAPPPPARVPANPRLAAHQQQRQDQGRQPSRAPQQFGQLTPHQAGRAGRGSCERCGRVCALGFDQCGDCQKGSNASSSSAAPQQRMQQFGGRGMSSSSAAAAAGRAGAGRSPPQQQQRPRQRQGLLISDERFAQKEENARLLRQLSNTRWPPEAACRTGDDQAPRPAVDGGAAITWVYPTNKEVREYQFDCVKEALFHNTLVALPTGTGKTFVAAVVMYNFYRWFPTGKIYFVAPTKPLCMQQQSAVHDCTGIPDGDTAIMNGDTPAGKRERLWRERRLFFCTPQTIMSDIEKGNVDLAQTVLLVVDEAHKATGNYAYVTLVREIMAQTSHFRVVALSARPGTDFVAIQVRPLTPSLLTTTSAFSYFFLELAHD